MDCPLGFPRRRDPQTRPSAAAVGRLEAIEPGPCGFWVVGLRAPEFLLLILTTVISRHQVIKRLKKKKDRVKVVRGRKGRWNSRKKRDSSDQRSEEEWNFFSCFEDDIKAFTEATREQDFIKRILPSSVETWKSLQKAAIPSVKLNVEELLRVKFGDRTALYTKKRPRSSDA